MNNDWFDRQLNEKYNMDRAPLDLEQAWAGFQQRRKKKRRPMGWWWLAGLLLAGMALGVWWASPEENVNTNRNSIEDVQREVTRPVDDDVSKNLITDETNPNKMMTEQAEKRSPSADLLSGNLANVPSTTLKNSAFKIGPLEDNVSGETKKKNVIFLNKSNDQIKEQQTDLSPPLVEEVNTKSREEKVNPVVGLNGHDSTKEFADPELISEQNQSILSTEHNIIDIEEKEDKDNVEIAINEDLPSDEVVVLLPKTKTSKWQTGLVFAYGFTQKSLKEKYAPHATLEPEDKPLDVMVAGWDIRYTISPTFFIQSGVNLQHYTDKRSIDYTQQRMWTDSNALVEQIIRADGMVTDIYGSVTVIENRRTTGVRYNTLTSFNIPVLVGMSQPVGKAWHLDIYGGIQGGFYQQSVRGFYTDECDACRFSGDPYRTWGTLDALLRIEPTYTFKSSGWVVGAGLYGVAGLNNRMNEKSGFTERRHDLGMSVVVRKQF
jgi:hypothetical protein